MENNPFSVIGIHVNARQIIFVRELQHV